MVVLYIQLHACSHVGSIGILAQMFQLEVKEIFRLIFIEYLKNRQPIICLLFALVFIGKIKN